MKNMKKFITLCGFLILGSIACGDADVVKAEAINNQRSKEKFIPTFKLE